MKCKKKKKNPNGKRLGTVSGTKNHLEKTPLPTTTYTEFFPLTFM